MQGKGEINYSKHCSSFTIRATLANKIYISDYGNVCGLVQQNLGTKLQLEEERSYLTLVYALIKNEFCKGIEIFKPSFSRLL